MASLSGNVSLDLPIVASRLWCLLFQLHHLITTYTAMDHHSPPWSHPLSMWVVLPMMPMMVPLHMGYSISTRFHVNLQIGTSLTVQLQQPAIRLCERAAARPLARSVKDWRDLSITTQLGRKLRHSQAHGAMTGAAKQAVTTIRCCLLLPTARAVFRAEV